MPENNMLRLTMPSKKLCIHFSAASSLSFYCLLKHGVIPNEYAERVCKGGESLAEACIKSYEIEKVKKAIDENVTINKLITVENMNSEAQNLEDTSSTLDEEETDFLEELLLKVPNAKNQLKKITKTTPPSPTPALPPTRPKLTSPPPQSEKTIIKTKNYHDHAKEYETGQWL